jgi:DNA-binding MarR family transcriptional regulator
VKEQEFACACATARLVARALTQLYDTALRGTGLEAPQFALLLTLDKAGPLSQAALGRRYALDKTTVSRNLRWLERQGWVQGEAGSDRRERRFALTEDGRERLAQAHPRWRKAQERLRAEMTEAEWTQMFAAFRNVANAAERMKGTRGPAGTPTRAARRVRRDRRSE